jgi:hypothetical protein
VEEGFMRALKIQSKFKLRVLISLDNKLAMKTLYDNIENLEVNRFTMDR